MKRIISVLVVVVMLICCGFSISANAADPEPNPQAASAAPLVDCQVVVGNNTRVVCSAAGLVVLNTEVNLPTVTLPPLVVRTTAPGTVTTRTVEVPGNTRTVTRTAQPEPQGIVTVTRTASPEPRITSAPTATRTINPTVTATSTATATATSTVTAPGQTETSYVTVAPAPTQVAEPGTDRNTFIPLPFPEDNPVLKAVVGTGYILAFLALLILTMWLGYYLGYKNSDRENSNFLKLISDQMLLRKR